MKQNLLNKPICPYKGRARPSKMGIILAIILALVLFCIPESFAKEAGKTKAEPMKKKTQVTSAKAEPVSEKFKETGKEDDQPAAEIIPVKPQQTQAQPASAGPTAGEEIKWQIISSGGTHGGSSSYQLGGTVGQLSVGTGSSESYGVGSGFWRGLAAGYARGDANGSGSVDLADAVFIVNWLFIGGPAPDPLWLGDANCSGDADLADAVYIVNWLFIGGPPPGC